MKNILVSIIIPTWNTANITLKNVSTINKFIGSEAIEIIIVDNASTDNTQNLFSKLKDIKYIRNNQNLGFSKANNIGAKDAKGEFLFFLNSDMELIDDSLIHMVKYLKNNPNIGIIGPQFLNPDTSIQGSITPPQTPINAFKEFWLNTKNSYSKYSQATTSSVHAISGGAILINKNIFNKIGGWDERYFFYYEDLELCRQIHKINKLVYYFSQCKVIHRHGLSGAKLADNLNQWRRAIPSAKIYFGLPTYYLIFFITWSSQQWQKVFQKN